jgi:hypothetical protein
MIQSTINYEKWKEEVNTLYSGKFGTDKTKPFIKHITKCYDKYNRNFLPHKIMWRAYDLHNKVTKLNQHQIYGFVGRGGYGKSTLCKNIMYYHDNSFNQESICQSMDDFVVILYKIIKSKNHKYRSIMIDEPSKETHQSSKEWRLTQDVLNQIRQENLFIGICATDISLIPSSLMNLVTGMYAFRKMYIYDYYDEEKKEGIIGKILKEYEKTKTYDWVIQRDILKCAYIRNYFSYKNTPIDCENAKYRNLKRKEFIKKVEKLMDLNTSNVIKGENKEQFSLNEFDKVILQYKKEGKTHEEIGDILKVPVTTIKGRFMLYKKNNVIIV